MNRLGEIKEKVWKWFSHLRNTTAVKNGKDRIFEAAVFLYRHWSIIDFEQKVLFDQKAISDFTDAMSRLDRYFFKFWKKISKTFFSNGNTIEVDEATRQLLAGEAYLSLDRIPPEFLQKPAKLQNRHSDEKFKVILYLEIQSNAFLGRSRLLQTNIQCWVQAQTTGKKSTRSGKKAKTRPSLVTFMSIWLSNHSPEFLVQFLPSLFISFAHTHCPNRFHLLQRKIKKNSWKNWD